MKMGTVPAAGESDLVFEGEGNRVLRAKGFRVDIIGKFSTDTPKQNSSAEELDHLSSRWKTFIKQILAEPERHAADRIYVEEYQSNDGAWVRFLSAGTDWGQPRPVTVAPLNTQSNYLMVKSLLLPENAENLLPMLEKCEGVCMSNSTSLAWDDG